MGAFLITWMESLLSEQFGDVWQLLLGAVMLIVVVFFPKGLIGTLLDWQYHRRIHRQSLAEQNDCLADEQQVFAKGEV